MKCRTARQKIRLLVGNDLGQKEVEPVQKHIAECVRCRKHVEEMLDSSDILTTYSAEALSQRKTSVWKSVVKQLPPQPDSLGPEKRRQLRQPGLAIGVAVLIMAAGILPDLIPNRSEFSSPGIEVNHPATAELPAGEYVREYPDQTWQSLELLDSHPGSHGHSHRPVQNVVGF